MDQDEKQKDKAAAAAGSICINRNSAGGTCAHRADPLSLLRTSMFKD
jgi:hypothetical protein